MSVSNPIKSVAALTLTLVSACAFAQSSAAPVPAPAPKPVAKVATAQAATAAPVAQATPRSPEEWFSEPPDMLFALLNTEVSIDFDETPAKEAIEYIQQIVGVQMVSRWLTERNLSGMDPAELISLKLHRVAAVDALDAVLAQLSTESSCTWQLRKGFLEIGTKASLSRAGSRETKLYPIKDLLYEVPYFDNAPDFNMDAALNQGSGGGMGGGGGGMGGGGGFGGGGGGGSGGGGGGGGSLFGNAGASPERDTDSAKAMRLIQLVKTLVEPEAWENDWAFIDYTKDCLIVRAPDFVHRALGGYAFLPPSRLERQRGAGRYVSFTAPMSFSQLQGFTPVPVGGAAGSNGRGGSGGGGSGGPNP